MSVTENHISFINIGHQNLIHFVAQTENFNIYMNNKEEIKTNMELIGVLKKREFHKTNY